MTTDILFDANLLMLKYLSGVFLTIRDQLNVMNINMTILINKTSIRLQFDIWNILKTSIQF